MAGNVVAFDTERKQRRSEETARAKEGRKQINKFLREVDIARDAGKLIDGDVRLAKALCNFPSATYEGVAWPGQLRLSGSMARSLRTIQRGLGRLEGAGLLRPQRRGCGRTNRYALCIRGIPILDRNGGVIGTSDATPDATFVSHQDAPSVSHQEQHDVTFVSHQNAPDGSKKSKNTSACETAAPPESYLTTLESIEPESPPNSPALPACSEPSDGQPKEWGRDRGDGSLDGEVLPPEGEIDFDTFWRAIKRDRGPAGPASAQWRKLSADDRQRIANLIGPAGIELDGMWATTWLADRRFDHAPLRAMTAEPLDIVRWRIVYVRPGDPSFEAEYQRRVEAGEPVCDMDWARATDRSFGMRVRDGGDP